MDLSLSFKFKPEEAKIYKNDRYANYRTILKILNSFAVVVRVYAGNHSKIVVK